MSLKEHWENIYTNRAETEVSWFQPHAESSMALIRETELSPSASIIDVGGGASTLADDIVEVGYTDLTVLDLSGTALATAKQRLGDKAGRVTWREGDILREPFPANGWDLWHDRAVFHFLTDPADRLLYVRQLRHALKPNGWVIIASFAEDGPGKCSGLPVRRYSPGQLAAELGEGFTPERQLKEMHTTPAGRQQSFVYCLFRQVG